jgi:hypothetical protein
MSAFEGSQLKKERAQVVLLQYFYGSLKLNIRKSNTKKIEADDIKALKTTSDPM